MPRHAVIQDGVVLNCVDYDATPNPVPGFPGDVVAIPNEIAGPGWTFAYATGVFTNPHTPSAEAQAVEDWKILRHFRDRRLTISDWTQAADVALDDTTVTAWQTYRQALRDLPALTVDPANPSWPSSPDGAF
jgi:hypothetical protein